MAIVLQSSHPLGTGPSLNLPPALCEWVEQKVPSMTPDLKYEPPPASPRHRRHIAARKLTGQKPARKMKEVWAIRIRLQLARKTRELALFNMAIDSKLRGCDLVRLRVEDVTAAGEVKTRAVIVQKKTGRPVIPYAPGFACSLQRRREMP